MLHDKAHETNIYEYKKISTNQNESEKIPLRGIQGIIGIRATYMVFILKGEENTKKKMPHFLIVFKKKKIKEERKNLKH